MRGDDITAGGGWGAHCTVRNKGSSSSAGSATGKFWGIREQPGAGSRLGGGVEWAWVVPLKCVKCKHENMRAAHQKVRLASLRINIEDNEEDAVDVGGIEETSWIKSIDGLLEVVDSPHCAHLWA
jgi:hypothetical protein